MALVIFGLAAGIVNHSRSGQQAELAPQLDGVSSRALAHGVFETPHAIIPKQIGRMRAPNNDHQGTSHAHHRRSEAPCHLADLCRGRLRSRPPDRVTQASGRQPRGFIMVAIVLSMTVLVGLITAAVAAD